MKPEGRKTVKFPKKRDVHPKKGWINWWESIADYTSRNTRKQKLKKEIENETLEVLTSGESKYTRKRGLEGY